MHMKNPYAAATSLGGNTARYGYLFLATASEIIAQYGKLPRKELFEKVYSPVTAIHDSYPERIAREIARAVDEIWDHGDREMLEEVLGHKAISKPMPAEVMQALANYISEGEKIIL